MCDKWQCLFEAEISIKLLNISKSLSAQSHVNWNIYMLHNYQQLFWVIEMKKQPASKPTKVFNTL